MATERDDYLLRIAVQVQNDRALQQLTQSLNTASKAAPQAGKAVQTATKNTAAFGRTAQNASYQLQDFIVQVQGGTDPMRALGQQLPQMLAGFTGIGVAIAGLTAAALPALITLFRDSSDEAGALSDNLGTLDSSIGQMARTINAVDFSNWIEEFRAASTAQREFMEQTLENDRILAQRARSDVAGNLAGTLSGLNARNNMMFTGNPAFMDARTQELLRQGAADQTAGAVAEELGLSLEMFRQVLPLLQRVADSRGADQEAVAALRGQLIEYNSTLEENNAALNDQIDMTWRLTEANKALADSENAQLLAGLPSPRERSDRAQRLIDEADRMLAELNSRTESVATPVLSGVTPYGGDPEILARLTDHQKAMSDEIARSNELFRQFNPEVAKYRDLMYDLDEALRLGVISQAEYDTRVADAGKKLDESLEGWTLGKEAVEVFDSSFQTMLDGVLQGTTSLSDGIKSMVKVMIAELAKLAAYKFIANTFAGTAIGDAAAGLLPNAKGNAFINGQVTAFARGGVVNGPTVFPMANGMGLMGEAGPEAVMPLSRDSRGRLGVSAGMPNITINNNAPGVDITPRQTDNGLTIDVVMNQMALAVLRGGNPMSDAMERTYTLGRGRGAY